MDINGFFGNVLPAAVRGASREAGASLEQEQKQEQEWEQEQEQEQEQDLFF